MGPRTRGVKRFIKRPSFWARSVRGAVSSTYLCGDIRNAPIDLFLKNSLPLGFRYARSIPGRLAFNCRRQNVVETYETGAGHTTFVWLGLY